MNDFQCERFFLPCDWPIRIRSGRLAVERTQFVHTSGYVRIRNVRIEPVPDRLKACRGPEARITLNSDWSLVVT